MRIMYKDKTDGTLCVDEVLDVVYDLDERKVWLTCAANTNFSVVFSDVCMSEYECFCREILKQGYSERFSSREAELVYDDEDEETVIHYNDL